MYRARLLSLSDYETLVSWWKANRFPPLGLDDLPMVNNELQGVIVSKDDIDLCAGFIIDTTVKNGAMLEYIVSNFEIKDRTVRNKSQLFLIQSIKDIAKALGKKYLYTSVKNEGLIPKYIASGFTKGSTNTTEMIIQL